MWTCRLISLAIATALVLGAPGCSAGPSKPESVTYTSEQQGFSLTYPGDWRKSTGYGMDFQVLPPHASSSDPFPDNIFVRVEPLTDPLTTEEFAGIKASLGSKNMPDYKQLEKSMITVGGWQACRVVYSATLNDVPVTSIAYFLVSGQRGYMVLATGGTDRFSEHRQQFEEIMKTFRLPGAAPAEAPAAAPAPATAAPAGK